jgi:RNA polymerase sigma-70 factor (ECF subfamily)
MAGRPVEPGWTLPGAALTSTPLERLDELADAVARGQRTAFEEIYLALVDDVYTYARGHCETQADAEDVVATVFLKAWQHARQYRSGSGNYRHWVFGIARNEVRNHWRVLRTARLLTQELETAPQDTADDPQPGVLEPEVVSAALKRLTHEQREVIILRYFNGKSHRAIAEVMGKKEGSIRALQHRALRQLRKAVTDASK